MEYMVTQGAVPKEFQIRVLSLAHDDSLFGHLGIKKTSSGAQVLPFFFLARFESCCRQVLLVLSYLLVSWETRLSCRFPCSNRRAFRACHNMTV